MSRIDKFCSKAIEIANDNSHGYNQAARWLPDFDCSSLVYYCARCAGYNVPNSGTRYTGTMLQHFSEAGFRCDEYDGNLSDLEAGDILLNVTYHTAIYIGHGKIVEASLDEAGNISGGKPGDQTGNEIHIRNVYNYPWTHVLTPPEDNDTTANVSADDIIKLAKQIIALAEKLK